MKAIGAGWPENHRGHGRRLRRSKPTRVLFSRDLEAVPRNCPAKSRFPFRQLPGLSFYWQLTTGHWVLEHEARLNHTTRLVYVGAARSKSESRS